MSTWTLDLQAEGHGFHLSQRVCVGMGARMALFLRKGKYSLEQGTSDWLIIGRKQAGQTVPSHSWSILSWQLPPPPSPTQLGFTLIGNPPKHKQATVALCQLYSKRKEKKALGLKLSQGRAKPNPGTRIPNKDTNNSHKSPEAAKFLW